MNRESPIKFRRILPVPIYNLAFRYRTLFHVIREFGGRHSRECSVCDHKGFFSAYGIPLIFDSMCPKCLSLGRHRQHSLLVKRHPDWITGADVLHFAPEVPFVPEYTQRCHRYVRANFDPGKDEVKVDMQAIPFDNQSFDTVIAHNVLEHVPDDRLALNELLRVLKPGGRAILSFPLVEAWKQTYEDNSIDGTVARDLHFNQWDHFRIYGDDVRQKISDAGFQLEEDVAVEPNVSIYALERGETIFICKKPV